MHSSTYQLHLENLSSPLPIAGFRAVERINALDRIDLRCAVSWSEVPDLALGSMLGRAAVLSVAGSAEGMRCFHGVVTREEWGARGGGRLRLEPRMSSLRDASAWRIFHGVDVLAVASKILTEHQVPFRRRLFEAYHPRPHWMQRGESDLSFLKRVLAEEGIFFFFDHPRERIQGLDETNTGTGEVLVLCDHPQGYSALLRDRPFRCIAVEEATRPGEERVLLGAAAVRRVAPTRTMVRRRDFERPVLPVVGDSSVVSDGGPGRETRRGLRYDHVGIEHGEPAAQRAARIQLDARRGDAATFRASTLSPHAMPGRILAVDALADTIAEEVVVVEAHHEGKASPEAAELGYVARLRLAPAAMPIRPQPTRMRRVSGLETATVLGPQGSEIHTDDHGRVQVRFHWDLEDGAPAAWLRVSQAWAGAGYGTNWLPRVGAEVLIGYVDGHPDRPIVLGSLHHPASPPAIRYPQDAHDVGIRTRSTPGGAGASELIFGDAAGRERVSLRSARDMLVESMGNTAIRVSGDSEHLTAGSHSEDVGGSVATKIDGNRVSTLGGHLHDMVAGCRTLRIGGDDSLTVAGASNEKYGAARFVEVAQTRHTFIGTAEQGGNEVVAVWRDVTVSAGNAIELAAKERMVLRCGDSSIVLMPDHIAVQSTRIEIHARERTEFQHGDDRAVGFAYDGAFSVSADTITLASAAGASLVLDADAKLDGALVKLNCGGASAGGAGAGVVGDDGEAVFRLGVAGTTPGAPYRFIIAAPDGERLDRDIVPGGEIRLRGRPGERFVLVEVQRDGRKVATRKRPSGEEG